MDLVVVVFLVLAVAALAVAVLRLLLMPRAGLDSESDVASTDPAEQFEIEQREAPGLTEGQVMLVPLPNQRNEALVLGSDEGLAALEASGLVRRTDATNSGPLPQVVRTVIGAGGSEAARRASAGVDQGRIVALSEETVKHLKANKQAVDKAGNALGLVRGDRGRIAHVARFNKAGAKAMTASNAATLAMTAALSQQLAAIEKQLTEIQGTLEGLVVDVDRKRLAETVATNKELASVARAIQRRGEMTEADWDRVAGLSLDVTTNATEADFKVRELRELLNEDGSKLNRHDRVEQLERLMGKERLEYWLALHVQADLALTRRDLLYLYWEQARHPDTARELADEVRLDIRARQEKLLQLGKALDHFSDPDRRAFTDPVRQLSRHRLARQDEVVTAILEVHGEAFAGPDADPYAVDSAEVNDMFVIEATSQ